MAKGPEPEHRDIFAEDDALNLDRFKPEAARSRRQAEAGGSAQHRRTHKVRQPGRAGDPTARESPAAAPWPAPHGPERDRDT